MVDRDVNVALSIGSYEWVLKCGFCLDLSPSLPPHAGSGICTHSSVLTHFN